MLLDEPGHDPLVDSQGCQGGGLIFPHQATVAHHVSHENGGQLAFEIRSGHGAAPILMVFVHLPFPVVRKTPGII
jgi:hypothetical protein